MICLWILDELRLAGNYRDSGRVVDPKVFSVKQLKWSVEQRYVDYGSVLEKSELVHLVNLSGLVTKSFSKTIENADAKNANGGAIFFESTAHYIKLINDYSSYVWIISIESDSDRLLEKTEWNKVTARAARLGMKVGVLDCYTVDLREVCRSGSSLRLYMSKQDLEFSFTQPHGLESEVFDWVESRFRMVVDVVGSAERFNGWYHKYNSTTHPVKLLFTSPFREYPPLYYSSVAARFSGHVHFGFARVSRSSCLTRMLGKQMSMTSTDLDTRDLIHVYTPEGNVSYGMFPDQLMDHHKLQKYLTVLNPQSAGILAFVLIVVNVCCFVPLFAT